MSDEEVRHTAAGVTSVPPIHWINRPTFQQLVQIANDRDGDGCVDERENGPNPNRGGQRDPRNFWDFFDRPTRPGFRRDKVISIGDIASVLARFGSNGGATAVADALAPPPPAYHAAYDRTGTGPEPCRTGPANGSITIEDITRTVASFGHACVER